MSPHVDKFLDSVEAVSELEASDIALVQAERVLCTRLAFARGMGWSDATEHLAQRINLIAGLRSLLAVEMGDISEREALQILGRPAGSPKS
jgi:hypothetical protein